MELKLTELSMTDYSGHKAKPQRTTRGAIGRQEKESIRLVQMDGDKEAIMVFPHFKPEVMEEAGVGWFSWNLLLMFLLQPLRSS